MSTPFRPAHEIFGPPLVPPPAPPPPRPLARVPLDAATFAALDAAGAPAWPLDGSATAVRFVEPGDPLDLPDAPRAQFQPREKLRAAVACHQAGSYAILRRQLGERFCALGAASTGCMDAKRRAALRADGRAFAAILAKLLPVTEMTAADRQIHEDFLRDLAEDDRPPLSADRGGAAPPPGDFDPYDAPPLMVGQWLMVMADRLSQLDWPDRATGRAWGGVAEAIAATLLKYETAEKTPAIVARESVAQQEALRNLQSLPSLKMGN